MQKMKTSSDDWKKLYQAEKKKYKRYLEATQISNLSDFVQKISPDISKIPILTNY